MKSARDWAEEIGLMPDHEPTLETIRAIQRDALESVKERIISIRAFSLPIPIPRSVIEDAFEEEVKKLLESL